MVYLPMKSLLLFFMVSLMALSINAQRCPVQDFQVGTGASEDIGSVRMPANGELALMTNNNAVGCGNSMSQESPSESLCLVGDNGQRKVTSAVPAGFVDLGLPSGTLWKTENESDFFTYEEALSRFGKNLPSKEDLEELKSECKWSWTGSGMKVTGPNGNSINLPAAGCRNSFGGVRHSVGSRGYYWSSTPNGSRSAWYLHFFSDEVGIKDTYRGDGRSVRLVQGNHKTKEEGTPKRAVPAGFVDLGLPSGKLWKDKNESGFFTYNQALSRFGKNLPSKEDLVELKLECKWSWTGSGYKVTGPNGNSIYLPASGCRNSNGNMDYVGSSGFYWSSSPGTSEIAWCLYFGSDRVRMYINNLSYGQSVRLVQDK